MVASLGLDPKKILNSLGTWALFAIVFAESGIMIGFFLPGDSLLFTAGLLSATKHVLWPFPLLVIGCAIAAIAGDQVGYAFGKQTGPRLFNRPDSRLFKREHLQRAEDFYDQHGSKTIIIARFVPVVRTFAPIVAGASKMEYRKFVIYNIIGGAAWSTAMLSLGYALGKRFPGIGNYLDYAVLVIVVLSLIPIAFEYVRHRRRAAANAPAVPAPRADAPAPVPDEGA
jgi:membrane-associated protein